jgi:hypothetical protein
MNFKEYSKIVTSNLEKMINSDESLNEFQELLLNESIGGNAGIYFDKKTGGRYSCACANFHVKNNGKIIRFTNDLCPAKYFNMGFRVVVDPRHPKNNLIVEAHSYDPKLPNKDFKQVIYGTVSIYNSRSDQTKKN